MHNDVQQRVLRVIGEVLDKNTKDIRLDASMRDDLDVDSLKQMTLFIALEDEFHRTIPPEEVTGLATVQDIIDFVIEKTKQSASP